MSNALPRAATEQHIAVLGKTGSGKTTTSKGIIEQLARENARVCVLDPIKSDWWGLISSADGKQPGLPFRILGGPRGHVPLHSSAGAAIAELVASGALPLSIIDMADFEPGGQVRFFTDFAPMLLRKMRGVLYLVLEEAHIFAPKERGGVGNENMSIHWAKMVSTAGRSKGIRLVVLTQRTQSLHNAVLGSCDTLIAHRLTAPADQKPVLDWLKANVEAGIARQVAASLSSLKTGEGWICSGEARIFERRHFPRIATYDNSATPTHDSTEADVVTAAVDVDALRAIIGDAAAQAEANDPKKLRKELAAAQARIAELEAGGPAVGSADVDELAAAEARGFELGKAEGYGHGRADGYLAALQHNLDDLKVRGERWAQAVGRVVSFSADTIEAGKPDTPGEYAPNDEDHAPPPLKTAPPPARYAQGVQDQRRPAKGGAGAPAASAGAGSGPGSAELGTGGLRRMLIALAQRPQGMSARALGVRAGLSSSSGTFGTYLGRGRSEGWMEGERDCLRITAAGRRALGRYEPLPTGRALLAYWIGELGNSGASRLLTALAEAYPRALSRDAAAERAGLSPGSGTFGTYLGKLRTLELVIGGKELKASAELFD